MGVYRLGIVFLASAMVAPPKIITRMELEKRIYVCAMFEKFSVETRLDDVPKKASKMAARLVFLLN